ncbi:hypothetical protein P7C70_g3041, partial [Phenoliferia sp. Uapishka_3]
MSKHYPLPSGDRESEPSTLPALYLTPEREKGDDNEKGLPTVESPNTRRHHSARAFALIFVPYLLAVALAVGHHVFNSYLNTKEVRTDATHPTWTDFRYGKYRQSDANRVNNVFASFAHMLAKVAVGTAWLQWAWRVVQRRSMSIKSIDALFSATSNPLSFFNIGMWKAASLGTIIALTAWPLAVISILPQASLTAVTATEYSSANVTVPTFSPGSLVDVKAFNPSGSASGSILADIASIYESYDLMGFRPIFSRAVGSTLISGLPTAATAPCDSCSFTQTVYAPAFNCSAGIPAGVSVNAEGITPIWSANTFGPGPFVSQDGTPQSPYGGHLAFKAGSRSSQQAEGSCYLFNASYTISSNFTADPSTVQITDRTLINQYPFYPTEVAQYEYASSGGPSSKVLAAMAFEAFKDTLYSHLNGSVLEYSEGVSQVSPSTLSVLETNLVANTSFETRIFWVNDLPTAMEQLMNNLTLSIITLSMNNATIETSDSFNHLVFRYSARTLFVPYIAGLGAAGVCIFLGLYAWMKSGVEMKAGFEGILEATRSTSLDNPEVVSGDAKIRYGKLRGTERSGFMLDSDLA